MGTVGYLSPEQVERGLADPRSDVYAAGIVLFEMLTGDKPYDGETALQIAYRHVHDDVPGECGASREHHHGGDAVQRPRPGTR